MVEEIRRRIEKSIEEDVEETSGEYEVKLRRKPTVKVEERRIERRIIVRKPKPDKIYISKLSDFVINDALRDNPSIMLFGPPRSGKTTFAYLVANEVSIDNGFVIYIDSEGNVPWEFNQNVIYIPNHFLPDEPKNRGVVVEDMIDILREAFTKAFKIGSHEVDLYGLNLTLTYDKSAKTFIAKLGKDVEFPIKKFLLVIDSLGKLIPIYSGLGKETEESKIRSRLLDRCAHLVTYLYNEFDIPSAFIAIQHLRSDPMLTTKIIEEARKNPKYRGKSIRSIRDVDIEDRLLLLEPKGESLRYILKETWYCEAINVTSDSITFSYWTWRSRFLPNVIEMFRITLSRGSETAKVDLKVRGEISLKRRLEVEY